MLIPSFSGRLARSGVALLAALGVLASVPASAFDPPPFPRIGGMQIGTQPNNQFGYYNAAYQAQLAHQSISVISDYPHFDENGVPMQTIIADIKNLNPYAQVFAYVKDNEIVPTNSGWADFITELNTQHWWLYQNGKDGTPVPAYGQNVAINNTRATQDSLEPTTGQRSVEWMTKYFIDNIYNPATNMDGFFMDNVFKNARYDGDWNRDGTTDSQLDPTVSAAGRQGYVDYVNAVRPQMPGKYQIGNIAEWTFKRYLNASGRIATDPRDPIPAEYQYLLEGGLLESLLGQQSSVESWGRTTPAPTADWDNMMFAYHQTMNVMLQPRLLIFGQWGATTDYQSLRYGLASCLMDDGYFSFTDQAVPTYSSVVSFDELNVNLGAAISPPQNAPWSQGVYRRDFENGIALVNPKGNNGGAPVTVTVEPGFTRVAGTQDPAVNSGQPVTQPITLQYRDGIILLRQANTTNTFGRTTIASAPSAGLTAHYKRASKFTLGQNSVVTSLSAYLDGQGGGTAGVVQTLQMEVYSDNNGTPDAKKAESAPVRITQGMQPQWVKFALPETQLPAGTYWIALYSGDKLAVARDYGDTSVSGGAFYGNADTSTNGASDPFGSGSASSTTLSVYGSYVPGTLTMLGAATAGPSPSSGLGADSKRGSNFVLGEAGTLTSFSAYLDGNGGAAGSQQVRMALYADNNGTPGNLVAQSSTVVIAQGAAPQWVNFPAPQTALTPGRYWIVIHTGGQPGIARDYGDPSGTSAWYGNNVDTFWDGANAQFGTGSGGATTLSVRISYVH